MSTRKSGTGSRQAPNKRKAQELPPHSPDAKKRRLSAETSPPATRSSLRVKGKDKNASSSAADEPNSTESIRASTESGEQDSKSKGNQKATVKKQKNEDESSFDSAENGEEWSDDSDSSDSSESDLSDTEFQVSNRRRRPTPSRSRNSRQRPQAKKRRTYSNGRQKKPQQRKQTSRRPPPKRPQRGRYRKESEEDDESDSEDDREEEDDEDDREYEGDSGEESRQESNQQNSHDEHKDKSDQGKIDTDDAEKNMANENDTKEEVKKKTSPRKEPEPFRNRLRRKPPPKKSPPKRNPTKKGRRTSDSSYDSSESEGSSEDTSGQSQITQTDSGSESDGGSAVEFVRRSHRPPKVPARFQPSFPHDGPIHSGKRSRKEKAYLSSSTSSDDEEYTRQARLAEAAMRPLNVPNTNVRADITPLEIDQTVDWTHVGGLEKHVSALKEMVMFPLMYPELFKRFSVVPPKGVIFYGPPGTGKTLVARALANSCSVNGTQVSFFMRKGADILSKWVGEAERQLRLLFEQAKRMEPSIIFFDEIDGLAPIRSSRQDQIHSSIVSTLLALMDGLDNRGQVIVIGATNRLDHIDPGLRRPGRFDREFLFGLPTTAGRREIFDIHTKDWEPPLTSHVKDVLATKCVGYCGADIKSLCSEASLRAVRRTFPQIYSSNAKLLIEPGRVKICLNDFINAMSSIVPASHRSSVTHARPLLLHLQPLLQQTVDEFSQRIKSMIPTLGDSEPFADPKFDPSLAGVEEAIQTISARYMSPIYRPRLLITGSPNMGQTETATAMLHHLEEFPIHCIDLPSLFSDHLTKTLEEGLVSKFKEATRNVPSILFLPHINNWWANAHDTLKNTFVNLLNDLDPTLPLCLLAVSDVPTEELDPELARLFRDETVVRLPEPTTRQLQHFWNLFEKHILKPQLKVKPRKYKELALAPPPPPREFTAEEINQKKTMDEVLLRKLRGDIRNIFARLKRNRNFQFFWKPISECQHPGYYQKILDPLDLSTIQDRNDAKHYTCFKHFLADFNLMAQNTRTFFKFGTSGVLNKLSELEDTLERLMRRVDHSFIEACEDATLRAERGPRIPHKRALNPKKKPHGMGFGISSRRKSKPPVIHVREPRDPGLNGNYWNVKAVKLPNPIGESRDDDITGDESAQGNQSELSQSIDMISSNGKVDLAASAEIFKPTNVLSPIKEPTLFQDKASVSIETTTQSSNSPVKEKEKEIETEPPLNQAVPDTITTLQTTPALDPTPQIQNAMEIDKNAMEIDQNAMETETQVSVEEEEEEEVEEVVIDVENLDRIIDALCAATYFDGSRSHTLESVLLLHSDLLKCVTTHKNDIDKADLLIALNGTLKNWIAQNKQRR